MDGIMLMPVRRKLLPPGHYVARRRTWPADRPWTVVLLEYREVACDDWRPFVLQFGQAKDEPASNWRFRSRFLNIDKIPTRPPPHPRIESAVVVPLLRAEPAKHLAS